MSNANTIKRQVGGNIVGGNTIGTLAPLLGSVITTTATPFGLTSNPNLSDGIWYPPIYDGYFEGPTSILLGGLVPLSVGIGLVADRPDGWYGDNTFGGTNGLFTSSGTQILHLAVTGQYSGATANTTTINLGLYEVPAFALPLYSTVVTAANVVTAGGQLVCSTGATAVTAAKGTFTFDIYLQVGALSSPISSGSAPYTSVVSGTHQAFFGPGTIVSWAATTTPALISGDADLNFLLSLTLGGAEAGVVVSIDEFRCDLEAPGASTIRQQTSGSSPNELAPLLASVIGTTPTAFQFNTLDAPEFVDASATNLFDVTPLSAGVTGLYQGTGQVLWVHATGFCANPNNESATLALTLYEVPAPVVAAGLTATSFAGWNSIGSISATSVNSGEGSGEFFSVDAFLQLDAQGNLQGTYQVSVAGTVVQKTAVTLIPLVGEADLNFVLVATLGGTTTGITLNLSQFSLISV
jgi:hypothetical protein